MWFADGEAVRMRAAFNDLKRQRPGVSFSEEETRLKGLRVKEQELATIKEKEQELAKIINGGSQPSTNEDEPDILDLLA